MAFPDKTGKMHHSASRARRHDEMAADKAPKPAMDKAPKAEPEKPEHESSAEPIEEVVKTHGPAHHVEIHHDEETGKHHVHSKHGDSEHEHHSVHDSAEEAHEHAGKAMGADGEEPDDEEAEGEEYGEAMPQMEQGSSRIPGMG